MGNVPRTPEPALPTVESAGHHPHPRPDPATAGAPHLATFEPRTASLAYHNLDQAEFYPRHPDEVEVQPDDHIVVRKSFGDGWLIITNMTRKTNGFAAKVAIGF
ncbi:hypothetical protein BDK51DRAFT_53069 [Blyttiomyces helicus]|uniref:SH3 domain-containing protein n=1 Tax=Blyttiomyces helicus TaxID=388810 RepID=A0A4P9WAV7_9FUNG|nr:hypothetical protein BDK51DRAFT_53069 [Blyttiomyces helicus]|eukprot:RKO88288.1 hypothetical protein BDK51DRAFT_53069 [Blyttiomyces helicus]